MSDLRNAHTVVREIHSKLLTMEREVRTLDFVFGRSIELERPIPETSRREYAVRILNAEADLREQVELLESLPAETESVFCRALPERRAIGDLAATSWHQLIVQIADGHSKRVWRMLAFPNGKPSALACDNQGMAEVDLRELQVATFTADLHLFWGVYASTKKFTNEAVVNLIHDAERELEHAEAVGKAGASGRNKAGRSSAKRESNGRGKPGRPSTTTEDDHRIAADWEDSDRSMSLKKFTAHRTRKSGDDLDRKYGRVRAARATQQRHKSSAQTPSR